MSHSPSVDVARSEETIFHSALAQPALQRGAFLDRVCAGNRVLRARVESLLRAHERANEFLERPPAELAHVAANSSESPAEPQPGDRIGRYKLLEKIGEGGCGVVYLAEQDETVRRNVALKIIKLGMDTKSVIARFEAERQALARMEHPNIARVLDAGATATGRPFFVMELVRGLRITDYCDQNNFPTERRLDLFIKVCQAIQHAHQKGIIHRDIKPSNILVTLHDSEPVPKVIDFGIAKATQGRLTDATLFTAFEQFIGTPAYVSPEQAEMSGLDVDTRSDIYSLGVLLYELLTGHTPFAATELMRSGLIEMRRRIREQEPPRPSHRLRTLSDADRTSIARRRSTDVPHLALQLRGDLDWIVMRCLEKDRARRYDTANGLARDVQRHLNNEPVTVRPPSTAYLFHKFVRRHRVTFVTGTAIAVTLMAGFAVSTFLYVRERDTHERARAAEATARREQARAEEARVDAELGRQRVQDEAARRAKLAVLMTSALKDIGLHVSLTGGDPRVLRDLVARTAELKNEFSDQPEIAAGVDETLSGVYFKLGDLKRAEELLLDALELRTRAQGRLAPAIADTLNYLGLVYSAQSRWTDAERCHGEALALLRERVGPEHTDVARALSARGWVLAQQARLHEAEQCLSLALEQQRKLAPAADIAATLMRLGSVLTQEGRVAEAEIHLREALRINERVFGRESLEAANSLNSLAVTIALTQARLPEAIRLYRDAFAVRERGTGARLPGSATETRDMPSPTLENVLLQRDDLGQVEAALRDAQRYALQHHGRDSWEEAFYHALRVWVLLQEQRFVDAEPIARHCVAIRETLRPDDWSTHHARHLLGAALAGQKRWDEAEPPLVDSYRAMKARSGSIPAFHKPRLGEAAKRIVAFYTATGRSSEAARWLAEFDALDEAEKQVLLPTRLN